MGKLKTALGYVGRLVPYLGEYLMTRGTDLEELDGFQKKHILLFGSARALMLTTFPLTSEVLLGSSFYIMVTGAEMLLEREGRSDLEIRVSTTNNNSA